MRCVPLAAALVAVLALPACGQRARHRDDARTDDASARASLDTAIAFGRTGTVIINAQNSDVIVSGSARNEIRVHAKAGRAAIRADAAANRASIELADPDGDEGTFEITVPTGAAVRVMSLNGEVAIRGSGGNVEVQTQNGDIRVQAASGRVDLTSLSGDIDARDLKGDVHVQGTSSTVTLARIAGDVHAETVSGDVTMQDMASKNVDARSVSSDVSYDGTIDPNGRYDLTSHSSDVSISIPASASAHVDASTWSGTIRSDFTRASGRRDRAAGTGGKQASFDVGGGSARISLTTFSGDITVHRRPR